MRLLRRRSVCVVITYWWRASVGASEVGSTLPRRCCLHTSLAFLFSSVLLLRTLVWGVWGPCGPSGGVGGTFQSACARSSECAVCILSSHMFRIGGPSARWLWIWAPSRSFSTVMRWACRVANSHWSVRQVGSLSLRSTLPHPRCLLLCPCHFASEHRELLGRWRTAVVF